MIKYGENENKWGKTYAQKRRKNPQNARKYPQKVANLNFCFEGCGQDATIGNIHGTFRGQKDVLIYGTIRTLAFG